MVEGEQEDREQEEEVEKEEMRRGRARRRNGRRKRRSDSEVIFNVSPLPVMFAFETDISGVFCGACAVFEPKRIQGSVIRSLAVDNQVTQGLLRCYYVYVADFVGAPASATTTTPTA